MLADLTREDWLKALQLPAEWAPRALWLRGTRNLGPQLAEHRRYFDEFAPFAIPNGLFEDFVIGRMEGIPVAFASVYGPSMASELTHVCGVLGAKLVLLTGCCGILADEFKLGDLLVATEAECGDGASTLYVPDCQRLKARMYGRDMAPKEGGELHFAPVHTTAALLAESRATLSACRERGMWGVDLETAAVYAVAEKFDMDRVAVLYGFDRPLGEQHLLEDELESRLLRAQGNAKMTGLGLSILHDYLKIAKS